MDISPHSTYIVKNQDEASLRQTRHSWPQTAADEEEGVMLQGLAQGVDQAVGQKAQQAGGLSLEYRQ